MSTPLGIRAHAEATPEKTAIIDGERTLSYGELHARVNRLANAFQDLGVGTDDKVSTLFHNSGRMLEAVSALGKIGAVPVALNYRFKGDELEYVVNQSDSKILIFGEEFAPTLRPLVKRKENYYDN